MNKNILTGMMRPIQLFFPPETGGGSGGGSASGNAGAGGNQQQQQQGGNQQQQQQQQTNEPPKFLGEIDDDLMDDDSRRVIEKARTEMREMHQKLQGAGEAEAKVKTLEAQLQSLQSGNGQQSQQQQQQQNQEPTLNDRLYQNLIEDGYKPEEARHLAKTLGKTLNVYSEEVQGYVDAKTQPMVARLMQQQLQGAFTDLQTRRAEAMAIPDVAQRVWERAENLQRQGMEVTYAVLENIMKQAHYDHITDPKNQGQQQQQQQQRTNTTMQQGNGGTRFTYPGAGHIPVVTRNSQQSNDINNLDPETKAALDKVDSHWKTWKAPGSEKSKTSVVRR